MSHRGSILENYLRKQHVNLTKLAERLPFTVRTMYRHFQEEHLELEKLLEYSQALNHDFSDDIPEMAALKFHLKEPHAPYKLKSNDDIGEAEYYRNKYEQLLEKYNEMLEQYNSVLQRKDVSTT